MAEKRSRAKDLEFPTVDGGKQEQTIPYHTHNGVDTPQVDKQNKKQLGVYSDYICVVNAGSTSIPNNTSTVIPLTAEVLDPLAMHQTGTFNSRITVPVTGVYRVTIYARWATNTTGDRGIALYKNGVSQQTHYVESDASGNAIHTFDYVLSLSSTDYLELYALQVSTAALALASSQITVSLIGFI